MTPLTERKPDSPRPAATALADWALALVPSEEDRAVADRALVDTVSVGVAAREHRIVRMAASLTDAGKWATVCHVLDFDDLHMPSTAHISTVCVPVALATGGGAGAYLAGAGVMARVGMALGWRHYSLGWHATTTAGALGAAVTAAVAFGLDTDQIARALALAVPAAGGVQRAFGTDAKSLQIGFAAEAGIRAAKLAAAGASADVSAVDDWINLVGGNPQTLDLKGPALPGGLAIKMYPACYALQRPISAVKSAVHEVDWQLDPSTVRRIRVRTPAASVHPLIHHQPRDGLQGKFSIEYGVATALLDKTQGFEEFSDEAVRRPEAERLMALVETILDGRGDSLLSGQVGIEIHSTDGVLTGSLQYPPGSPQRPPTAAELAQKLATCLKGTDVAPSAITWESAAKLLRSVLDAPRS